MGLPDGRRRRAAALRDALDTRPGLRRGQRSAGRRDPEHCRSARGSPRARARPRVHEQRPGLDGYGLRLEEPEDALRDQDDRREPGRDPLRLLVAARVHVQWTGPQRDRDRRGSRHGRRNGPSRREARVRGRRRQGQDLRQHRGQERHRGHRLGEALGREALASRAVRRAFRHGVRREERASLPRLQQQDDGGRRRRERPDRDDGPDRRRRRRERLRPVGGPRVRVVRRRDVDGGARRLAR